ncbi:S1-like domain-containing protein [Haematococcus lacustris]|uniref:Translation initiation factor IF-1, chloroplastic n=1 Tax=Haematococcus lacustris TaxID=44745 RepID=A0A699ZPK6_HAELA|nr:S1-like domain-containing protein [Haematococcus lacustris]
MAKCRRLRHNSLAYSKRLLLFPRLLHTSMQGMMCLESRTRVSCPKPATTALFRIPSTCNNVLRFGRQTGGSHLCSTARPVTLIASQAGVGPSATGTARPYKKKVKKLVDITGFVVKDLGNGMFSIKLENGVSVMAHLSGKIRQNRIKIVSGDQVTVELSPYDLTRGRITHRHKPGELAKAAEAAEAAKAL